jgi:hypothetical protein
MDSIVYDACMDAWMNGNVRIFAMKKRYPDAMRMALIVFYSTCLASSAYDGCNDEQIAWWYHCSIR